MAITVVKKKVAPQVEEVGVVVEQDSIPLSQLSDEALADLYGRLEDEINSLETNPIFREFSEVAAELKSRLEDVSPEAEVAITGNKWELSISACSKNARKLKSDAIPVLMSILGSETFAKLASVKISDIDKYCTPAQAEKVIDPSTGYSKTRKIVAKFKG